MEVVRKMKKSLLAMLFAVALAVPAMAEGMWIGGSASYENTNVKDGDSVTAWEIAPEFGMNLSEKWDIGIAASYGSERVKEKEVTGSTINGDAKSYSIAPFARYKLMSIGDFSLYAKGSVFYENTKYTSTGSKDVKVDSYGIEVVPVVEYAINDAWSISCILNFASLGYTHDKSDMAGDPKADSFGFKVNGGSVINVGVAYHF